MAEVQCLGQNEELAPGAQVDGRRCLVIHMLGVSIASHEYIGLGHHHSGILPADHDRPQPSRGTP
jgi:hypothetical protein